MTSVKSSQYSLTLFPAMILVQAYSSSTLVASSSLTLPVLRNANSASENNDIVYGKEENECPHLNMLDEVGVKGILRVSLEFENPRIMLFDCCSRQVIGAVKGVVLAMLWTSKWGRLLRVWNPIECGNDGKKVAGYKAGDGEE